APFLNVQMTFDCTRSILGFRGNDVCSHQLRPRSSSMVSAENNTSGPNSELKTTAMNSQVQSWFQKLFLKQSRQLHHDKSWNYYSTII
ncbi:hypothetical protein Tco_0384350, partial [Tanacetum coccineum]